MGIMDANVRIIYEYMQMMLSIWSHACIIFNSARAARVSCDKGARCVHFTAPVGGLVAITLHVLHGGSCCAFSIQQSASHELECQVVIASVLQLSLCVSSQSRVTSSRRSAFLLAGARFSYLPALRDSSLPALFSICFLLWSVLALVSNLCSALVYSLSRLFSSVCFGSLSSLPRLSLSLIECDFYIYPYKTMLTKSAPTTNVSLNF